jgi:hypothetical protein
MEQEPPETKGALAPKAWEGKAEEEPEARRPAASIQKLLEEEGAGREPFARGLSEKMKTESSFPMSFPAVGLLFFPCCS